MKDTHLRSGCKHIFGLNIIIWNGSRNIIKVECNIQKHVGEISVSGKERGVLHKNYNTRPRVMDTRFGTKCYHMLSLISTTVLLRHMFLFISG